jgi:hypothetical protein
MRYCPFCGKELGYTSFSNCPYCGKTLTIVSENISSPKITISNKNSHGEIVKRIRIKNILIILVGLAGSVLGSILFWLVWNAGWIVYFVTLIPLMGFAFVLLGSYTLINPSHDDSFKCWKNYGISDDIINDINTSIKKTKDKEIISNGWFINSNLYLFTKLTDINWIHNVGNKSSNTVENIKIYTNFGVTLTARNVTIINNLLNISNNAIIGYDANFEKIWKNNPKNFYANVKNILNSKY